MDTKTFKAGSMLEALQMVQSDLGPDAIVLSARETEAAAWGQKRPGVEVVAMAGSTPTGKSLNGFLEKLQAAQSAGGAPASARPAAAVRAETEQIEWVTGPEPRRAQIPVYPPAPKSAAGQAQPWQPPRVDGERRPASGASTAETPPAAPLAAPAARAAEPRALDLPGSLEQIHRGLVEQGVDEGGLERIFKVARQMIAKGSLNDVEICRKYVAKLLEADLKEQVPNALSGTNRVVCLAGASGSGKTSTAAKLALLFSRRLGRKVTWICADTLRTGAIPEARAYADALGLELKLAYTPEDLRAAVAEADAGGADFTLVDTSGFNPFREDQMVELGRFLSELRGEGLRPACSLYFTAAANVKENDLVRAAAALGIFGLDGVILTHLDETNSYGSVYNFARKAQVTLGYFSAGRGADGTFQNASAARLVAALFGKGWGN